jgi:hypothetical protein
MAPMSAFGLRLHHSRSFAEEFEEELSRYSSFSNYSTNSRDEILLEEELRRRSGSEHTLTEHVRQYSTPRASTMSDTSTHAPSASAIASDSSTPRFQHLQLGEIVCTRTVEISEGTRTPSPERSSTPKSPNTLNQLNERDPAFIRALNAMKSNSQIEANEQDPAFIRTVNAMRSNSQTYAPVMTGDQRPQSLMVPSMANVVDSPTQRSASSLSARTNDTTGSVRRRYLSFVGRLWGRAEA